MRPDDLEVMNRVFDMDQVDRIIAAIGVTLSTMIAIKLAKLVSGDGLKEESVNYDVDVEFDMLMNYVIDKIIVDLEGSRKNIDIANQITKNAERNNGI
jgi:hypothetical protein